MNLHFVTRPKTAIRDTLRVASIAVMLLLLFSSCAELPTMLFATKSEDTLSSTGQSVVRVRVTRQRYNFHRPWQQRTPNTQVGIGAIIAGSHVLIIADAVADHRYIELEKIDGSKKSVAELVAVDYEANLALLKPIDTEFLADAKPLKLETKAVQGDTLAVWQVKPNGTVTPAPGSITSIELARFPYNNYFLAYRLNGSLQYRFRHFTLPVIKDGKLAGLLMQYNAKEQTIDVIAAPVIEHFLEDAADGTYQGFPLPGMNIVSAEDPQLRRYVGISKTSGGVFVDRVLKGSAADRAGVRQGDIVTKIAGFDIDSLGNYNHPDYGKISLLHLVRCQFHVGEEVVYNIFRAGKAITLAVSSEHRPAQDYIVPPYIIDTAPRYIVLGGLVLQELSESYLREYGKNWSTNAPIHLLYDSVNQHAFEKDGREKIVFLSGVLPTSYTVGYDKLSNLVVTRINDQDIGNLEDVIASLSRPVDGFHKIEFEQRPKVVFLDALELPEINAQIKQKYRVPVLMNLN